MIGQTTSETDSAATTQVPADPEVDKPDQPSQIPEYGGREGLDPTRYGDWEKNGRCIDF
ncbi:DUF1674 domain-containing protein [Lysobacter sp. A03]|uniref:DUF1674 domain-containing protein n=1 Tax=Lysobacter sp. A03 TaxID=1199154 RepID=UPI0005B72CE1|nr:DUF1674 domain-containing protein [Lysobacter sp. A03]KIQ98421.1 hypothetical protein TI01_0065 [Lysobacter sp. A03]